MMRPTGVLDDHGEKLWQCEEHPSFQGPEAAAAVHLRLFHPDLWSIGSRTEVAPVPPC